MSLQSGPPASGSGLRVRQARPLDARTLAEFNRAMARETEQRELDPARALRGVERLLHMPEAGFYLLAERSGLAQGSLMVTPEWSDWRDAWFWWIQSVYVIPTARKTGIYRALHDEVRRIARERGDVCGLRLYVEGENLAAQEVYRRLGMKQSVYRLYEEPWTPPSGA